MLPIHSRVSSSPRYLQATLFGIALISLAANSAVANSSDIPIRFATGQVSTTVSGKLTPKQHERWYQFSAASGQYTIINITPLLGKGAGTSETANVGVLHMPNGQQDGTKGGIIYQGCLPASGEYRLRIARNLMATQGKTAGYTTEIIILPKYASQALCK
ncbi:hypothetical protein ES754_07715 [Psychrobacter frigidicola]|uniref:Uncharacterized protein n=1 Tax=Psychrobacter frigidicola TaxID=45611 RepID=A0A5C7A2W6_9GAMM|nr:hypothetical protein [Psychrobacter frigidicola]TXD96907.1 hypothetical protein ES754_07715 [Psychrobacter frigidicola]